MPDRRPFPATHKEMKINYFGAAIAALFSLTLLVGNAQIVAWEFNGNAGNEATVNATTNNANLNTVVISRGAGVFASNLSNAYSSNGWASNSLANAITANDYYQFAISANAGYDVSLSTLDVNFRRSGTGPTDFQWQYSLDGFSTAGVNIGSAINYTSNPTNGTAQTQLNLSGIGALQNVATGTTITIRLFGWNGSGGGTFALGRLSGDDLAIGGTVNTLSTNTSVEFTTTSSTVSEGVGTVTLTMAITDEDAINDTEVDVVLTSGSAARINGYTTQTVTFPGGSSANQTLNITVTDNSLCDGQADLTFQLQNISGGQGTPFVGTNDEYDLTINDNNVCPVMEVDAPLSATVAESDGTTDITLEITDPSATLTSAVDVVLISGSATRINNYTTQTVNWAANDGADKTVTITLTDDPACNGDEVLVFELQNAGGTSGATIGTDNQFTLTVTDDQTLAAQTLAFQGFESSTSDTWSITSGAGAVSSATGGGDFPSNERILNGSNSFQTNNSTNTMDFATINVAGSTGLSITARLSSTAGTSGNGADGADEVELFVNIDGAGFPVTPDLTVSGNSNAKWGFSTGTGVASATAGTPASFAPAGGGFRTTDGYSFLQVDIPDGATTVALRITADNNSANEYWNIEDIQLSGDVCQVTYYSQGSGNVTDAIWDLVPSGTGAVATFGPFTSMVVQNGHTVTQTTDLDVYDFTLDAGGTYGTATTSEILNLWHDLDLDDSNFGPLNLDLERRSAPNNVSCTSGLSALKIEVRGDGVDFDMCDCELEPGGEFNVNSGVVDMNNNALVLRSDATGTALIGDLSNGTLQNATNVTMERYIPGGVTNWRNLASPVTGTLEDWDSDFITSGIPNSDFPLFEDDNGDIWPSIYLYDENNVTTPLIDEGFVAPTDMTNAFIQGAGYWVWCGDSLSGTDPFTIDATGTPGVGPVGITLDNSITVSSTVAEIAELGWNMVGNPLPSPFDWSAVTLTGNIEDRYWIYDPVSGNTGGWDEGTLSGTGGLNGNIQSSQAFWVHCDAFSASDVLTIDEDAKVSDAVANGLFGGSDQQNNSLSFRLKIESNMNSFYDEVLVRSSQDGLPGYDSGDMFKLFYSYPTAPTMSTMNTDGQHLIFNDMGPLDGDSEVPVYVKVGMNGTYTMSVFEAQYLMQYSCLVLEDLQTGTSTTLSEGATYSFTANVNDPDTPRFLIHLSAPVTNDITAISCNGAGDGEAVAQGSGSGPWTYTWYDNGGNVLLDETLNGASQLDGLAAGEYSVEVSSDSGCGSLINSFEIVEPNPLDAAALSGEASCSQSGDGVIDLQPMGGTMPLSYQWSNGETTEDLNDLNAGVYHVLITDANDCQHQVNDIEVLAETELIANIGASATEVLVNEPIAFNNNSTGGTDLLWDFGDGSTSTDNDPFHSYALPGSYQVTLALSEEDCSSSDVVEIEVSTSVGIADLGVGNDVRMLQQGTLVQLFFELADLSDVEVQLFDMLGSSLRTESFKAMQNGQVDLELNGFAQGVYLVNIQVDGEAQSFKVIKR